MQQQDRHASRDGVIAAWKKGGLPPAAFTTAKTAVGKDCPGGTVNKVDVMVCSLLSGEGCEGRPGPRPQVGR